MAESVRVALARATERLAGSSPTARLDAELLMAHALGIARDTLLIGGLDAASPAGFDTLVERRLAHEPVAYLTVTRGFWTIELAVSPAVLIPRADSETLIAAAVARFAGTAGPARILDLGTGSGALLLAALAEWPPAWGLGIDRSAAALAVARDNAARNGLARRARFLQGDWAAALAGRFDLVLANPPYVAIGEPLGAGVARFEPADALWAGADGLDAYRALAPQLPRLLADGGLACVEIGHAQAETAGALFRDVGLAVAVVRDLADRDRCLVIRAPPAHLHNSLGTRGIYSYRRAYGTGPQSSAR